MADSGLRRGAGVILALAVSGAIGYVAVVWTTGNWGGVSPFDMVTDALLPYWTGALTRVCVVVMAYAAVRSLAGDGRMGRLVWASLIVAVCSSLTSRTLSYFRWESETAVPSAVLEIGMVVMVFLLAQLVIHRVHLGRD